MHLGLNEITPVETIQVIKFLREKMNSQFFENLQLMAAAVVLAKIVKNIELHSGS